jgi:hypothetical protein
MPGFSVMSASPLRSNTKPNAGQANYNDRRGNRAGRDVGKPIAVHVPLYASGGGDRLCRADYLPVRRHRPIRHIAGIRLCGGRITERLVSAHNPRNFIDDAMIVVRFRPHEPKHEATNSAPSGVRSLGVLFDGEFVARLAVILHPFALPFVRSIA